MIRPIWGILISKTPPSKNHRKNQSTISPKLTVSILNNKTQNTANKFKAEVHMQIDIKDIIDSNKKYTLNLNMS